eukprot:11880530-Alexandrium_andersonii.AAC.1
MVSQIPIMLAQRRAVVSLAPTTALAWGRLRRPLRVCDRKSYAAAARVAVCRMRWISAEPSLLMVMAIGHGAVIVAKMAHRLDTIIRRMQDRLGVDNTKVLVDAAPEH